MSREEAFRTYEALVARDKGTGATRARRKDGTEVALRFRGRETRVGGMTFYVGIAWPDD